MAGCLFRETQNVKRKSKMVAQDPRSLQNRRVALTSIYDSPFTIHGF